MNKHRPLRRAISGFAFLGCLTSGGALGAAPADDRVIEEVLVVSTKRAQAELAQDVPVASTVVSAAMIDENNFNDLVDVARMVPGADFRQTATFPGIQRFWLRAVGVSFSVPNFDPAVGVYQDGVFVAQNIASILDTFDMESIEVLRGPQGTLFGRNTSVGAVVSRTRRPGDEFLVRAQATAGSFERMDFAVSAEGPLVEGQLKARLSLQARNNEGWMNDLSGGPDFGELDTTLGRATLVWTPADNFDLTLIGEYYDRGGDGAISTPITTDDLGRNHPLMPDLDRDWDETYGTSSPHEGWESFSDHEIKKGIAEANWDLGHGMVTSVTGLIDVLAFSGAQFEGLPSTTLSVITRLMVDQDQFSQELRYASSFSETFDFTVGLFYFDQNLTYGEQRSRGDRGSEENPFGLFNPNGTMSVGHDILDHDSFAIFAESRINLTDRLTATIGGRYTDETKDVQVGLVNSGACLGPTAPPFEKNDYFVCSNGAAPGGWDIVDGETWKSFSPKVGLSYKHTDEMLLYAGWTRGFRSGGFSFRASPTELDPTRVPPGFRPAFYDEERVDSLEVGMKSDFYDNRVRLNLTAYYQWWDGIQRNLQAGGPTDAIQRTANVDDSYVYGFEGEFSAIVALDAFVDGDSWRIDGALGVAGSGYKSDYFERGQDLSGQKFGAPHNTAFLGVTYEHPVGAGGAGMSWRASYFWKGQWWNEGVRVLDFTQYNARNLIDASVQYTSAGGNWFVKAFGKNLTYDKNYAARVVFARGANPWGLGNPTDPRTFGVTVGFQN